MRHLRKTEWFFRAALAFAFLFALSNCGRSGSSNATQQDPGDVWGPPGQGIDPSIFGPSGQAPGTGNTGNGGSASGGGLTEADQFALKNVFQEQTQVAPQQTSGLSQSLLAEAKRLLDEEAKGRDVAVAKMALAGRMLTECAERTAPLAPIPGQPLLGVWASTDQAACKVNFTIAGTGANATYQVQGDTRGTMKATNQGDGTMNTEPFQGRLTDRPESGTGTLTNPQFTKTKYGYQACSTAVALKNSANPIPANYQEAMKRMGMCFRQALVLMSPVFDQMFANMNPQLRVLLQQRMLGIQGQ